MATSGRRSNDTLHIGDIARRLNLSRATVSNALTGNRHVAPATVRRVKELCRELGYTRNVIARGLRTKKTGVVGVTVPNVSEPFIGGLVRAIEMMLKKHGYHMFIGSYYFDTAEEERLLSTFRSFMVDAVIAVSGLEQTTRSYRNMAEKTPVVFLSRDTEADDVPTVVPDNFRVGTDAVDYLVVKGHRSILHLTIPFEDFVVHRLRAAGFVEGIKRHCLPFGESCVMIEPRIRMREIETSIEIAERVRRTGATAVFVVSDFAAVGLLKGLTAIGVNVPRDVSVLSCTNTDYALVTTPALSSIDFSSERMAEEAVASVLSLMRGQPLPERRIVTPHRIVERESVLDRSKDQ